MAIGIRSGTFNLGKKNFFNDLTEFYPQAMEWFTLWIDDYKRETNWDRNFGCIQERGEESISPCFYELPFEMQMGMIICFFRDMAEDKSYPHLLNYIAVNDLVDNFEIYVTRGFGRLEYIINHEKDVFL